jgi:hypothetical protein
MNAWRDHETMHTWPSQKQAIWDGLQAPRARPHRVPGKQIKREDQYKKAIRAR